MLVHDNEAGLRRCLLCLSTSLDFPRVSSRSEEFFCGIMNCVRMCRKDIYHWGVTPAATIYPRRLPYVKSMSHVFNCALQQLYFLLLSVTDKVTHTPLDLHLQIYTALLWPGNFFANRWDVSLVYTIEHTDLAVPVLAIVRSTTSLKWFLN